MRNSLVLCVLALVLPLASCFTVDHFKGDAARYDGLFFGPDREVPLDPPIADSEWRNYAIFGIVPWSETKTRFAGDRLALVGNEMRPMKIVVTSEQTFINGLAGWGLAVIIGPFGPLLFVPRSIEVAGWRGQ